MLENLLGTHTLTLLPALVLCLLPPPCFRAVTPVSRLSQCSPHLRAPPGPPAMEGLVPAMCPLPALSATPEHSSPCQWGRDPTLLPPAPSPQAGFQLTPDAQSWEPFPECFYGSSTRPLAAEALIE